jgi:hypothetical protein
VIRSVRGSATAVTTVSRVRDYSGHITGVDQGFITDAPTADPDIAIVTSVGTA